MQNERHPTTTREGGYALPVVLMGLIGLATLSTAGYVVARSDLQVTRNFESSVDAFYYADAGMSSYLAAGSSWTTGVTYAGDDGAATITSQPLLLLKDGSSLHHVTSTGSHAPDGDQRARRDVSAVIIHQLGKAKINSALTAVAGLHKNGVAGTVNGLDVSSQVDCPLGGMNNVAGLQVPNGEFEMNGADEELGGIGGVYPGFYGDPPVDESQDAEDLLEDTEIDWAGWLEGSVVAHDYVVSEDGWPDFSELDEDEWPVIYVDDEDFEVTASMSGRGTIIAAGNVTMNGAVQWDGLIFVGDKFTSNGNQTVEGSVVTGLNLLLEDVDEVEASDLGNGSWTYQYHSCNVLWALRGMGAGVMEPGSWYETLSATRPRLCRPYRSPRSSPRLTGR